MCYKIINDSYGLLLRVSRLYVLCYLIVIKLVMVLEVVLRDFILCFFFFRRVRFFLFDFFRSCFKYIII